jgi:hypothetical protein
VDIKVYLFKHFKEHCQEWIYLQLFSPLLLFLVNMCAKVELLVSNV